MGVAKQSKDLDHILEACRRNGVRRISFDGYSIEFGNDNPVIMNPEPRSTQKFGVENGNPTEDDMLYWSTPDGIETQAVPPINK